MYLTYPQKAISVGNLLGDLVGNRTVEQLIPVHQEGVVIHRFIDSFTDRHESLDEARAILRERHRKYAPVVLDILLDYVLVEEWSEYASVNFEVFQEWVYGAISSQVGHVPQSAAIRMQHMANGRWLNSYTNPIDFQMVLDRMDRRARFESHFAHAMTDLNAHREVFRRALQVLMGILKPQIDEMVEQASLRNGERS